MEPLRPRSLSLQLALASLVSVLALGAVCGVGVVSMRQLSVLSRTALQGQMDLIGNTSGLQELLYQKGFVASYMVTGDRDYLAQLDRSRTSFAHWLEHAQDGGGPAEVRQSLLRIAREYGAHDQERRQIIDAFDGGKLEEAKALLTRSYASNQRLLSLCHEYTRLGEQYAQRELALTQSSLRQRTEQLLLSSIAGILASLAMGYLLARRIARPIYELQLQVASAVQKTRLSVAPGRAGLESLGDHMAALLRKLEETDAAILEQRNRLIQSEKLSAIGDVAAKLAHEILNPLAGMKAAAQLLLRSSRAERLTPSEVAETASALDQEISRVDQLVRRLINYAKPLSPRREPCQIETIFDAVSDATKGEVARGEVRFLRELAPDLPAVEVDPLLLTQALVNLVVNAVQAAPPKSTVQLVARRQTHLGQEHVAIQVLDEGLGISPESQEKLFHPFFTTKPKGHGLGLAMTQNIIMEHGGQIAARNRDGHRGALFEVMLPLSR